MKSKEHPVPDEFEDHPNLDDKDLVHELLNEHSWYSGYEDEGFVPTLKGEVFTPTRKELLVLFNHWYKAAQHLIFHNSLCYSTNDCLIVDEISHRLCLIATFLPKEVLEVVSKQLDEEDLKVREKAWPEIAEMMGDVGEEEKEREKQMFLGRIEQDDPF